jgi:hypothetical protein
MIPFRRTGIFRKRLSSGKTAWVIVASPRSYSATCGKGAGVGREVSTPVVSVGSPAAPVPGIRPEGTEEDEGGFAVRMAIRMKRQIIPNSKRILWLRFICSFLQESF